METPPDLVAHNVRYLRDQRGHTVRSLSALLGELGRPILPSGITKIEDGSRRVDVGDLVALAVALNITPARLLLPVADQREQVALTPAVTLPAGLAWPWVRGEAIPAAVVAASGNRDMTAREMIDDFRRYSEPAFERERLHNDHTAVRAALDVLDRARALIDEREELKRDDYTDAERKDLRDRTAAGLRRAVARLVAEVDDLIGGDGGER